MSDFKHPRSYVLFCSNFKPYDLLWPIKLHTGRQLFRQQLLQSASPHTMRGSGCTGYSWEKPLISVRGCLTRKCVRLRCIYWRAPPKYLASSHSTGAWEEWLKSALSQFAAWSPAPESHFFPNVCVHTSVCIWNAISLLCNLVSLWSGTHWSG